MSAERRHCARCGAEATGNFCSSCGAPLGESGCESCGAKLKPGALYCPECGAATGERSAKSASSRLPWILSFLALAAFSVVIAVLVQGESTVRTGDMTLTGGIPGQPGGAAAPAPAGGAGMPTAEELAAMPPREAADRLFERAMSSHGGSDAQGGFFVNMALQAYDRVSAPERDADFHFHVGLLRLVAQDSVAARESAETILAADEDHLLGLLLAARVARFRGEPDVSESLERRVREIVEAEGGVPDRPEYQAHRPLIDQTLSGAGG